MTAWVSRVNRGLACVASLLLAMSASAIAADSDRKDCIGNADKPDVKVAACTRVIEDSSETVANRVIAHNNRGIAYRGKKDYDRALADYAEALKLDPKFAAAHLNRGLVHADKREFDRAIEAYGEAIKLNPKYVAAYNNRGNAYFDKKEFDRAIADYTEAIKIDPNFKFAHAGRGRAWTYKGEYDRGISDLSEAIRLDPKFTFAWYQRCYSHFYKMSVDKKGGWDPAIADCSETIKLDPKYLGAYENSRHCLHAKARVRPGDSRLQRGDQARLGKSCRLQLPRRRL